MFFIPFSLVGGERLFSEPNEAVVSVGVPMRPLFDLFSLDLIKGCFISGRSVPVESMGACMRHPFWDDGGGRPVFQDLMNLW